MSARAREKLCKEKDPAHLNVQAALRVRDEADLAGLALSRERLDVVRDVLGSSLSVSETGVRQSDPAHVEARSRVGQQLDVRSVGPSTLGFRGGVSVQPLQWRDYS